MALVAMEKNDGYDKKDSEVKLELYSMLGEGYKAMQSGRESSIDDVMSRIQQRRNDRG